MNAIFAMFASLFVRLVKKVSAFLWKMTYKTNRIGYWQLGVTDRFGEPKPFESVVLGLTVAVLVVAVTMLIAFPFSRPMPVVDAASMHVHGNGPVRNAEARAFVGDHGNTRVYSMGKPSYNRTDGCVPYTYGLTMIARGGGFTGRTQLFHGEGCNNTPAQVATEQKHNNSKSVVDDGGDDDGCHVNCDPTDDGGSDDGDDDGNNGGNDGGSDDGGSDDSSCDGGNPGNLKCKGKSGEDPNGKGSMDNDNTGGNGNGEHGNQGEGGNSQSNGNGQSNGNEQGNGNGQGNGNTDHTNNGKDKNK